MNYSSGPLPDRLRHAAKEWRRSVGDSRNAAPETLGYVLSVVVVEAAERIEYLQALSSEERELMDAALRDPWSFKQGTLREKLEWARAQHLAQADAPIPARISDEAWRDFHLGCAEWYAGMLVDLDAAEATA